MTKRGAAVVVMAMWSAAWLLPAPAAAQTPPPHDDSWIAFVDDNSILVVHPDGRDRRVVVAGRDDQSASNPDLSPDGARIAFRSCTQVRAEPVCWLTIVDRSGENLRNVTPADGDTGLIGSPTWSPDGQWLAYTRKASSGAQTAFIARTDGSQAQRIDAVEADWGPDGEHLVVTKPGGTIAIKSLRDGSERVIAPNGSGPRWSPDGQRIAFTTCRCGFHMISMLAVVVNVDGSGQVVVAGGRQGTPSWAPDSHGFATTVEDEDGVHRVAVIDLGRGDLRKITTGRQPSWSNPAAVVRCTAGYWLAGSDGGVFTFGTADFHGSLGGVRLNRPVVHMAATSTGHGYWLLGGDGGVFTFGDAGFFGSTGGMRLQAPVLAMAPTRDDGGYWLVASDGGVFTFGDARFFGSTGGMRLSRPVVGMAPTPTGQGYWLVASDGGVFTFGDAEFYGALGRPGFEGLHSIVAIVPTPSGKGYWLIFRDGESVAYGDATTDYLGQPYSVGPVSPVVGATAANGRRSLLLATVDGQVVPLGDADFCGSRYRFNERMVGVAAA